MRLPVAGWASGVLLALAGTPSALSPLESTKLNQRLCPAACTASSGWSTWFEYHSVQELAVCDEPLLLTFSLFAPIDDAHAHTAIRACTVGDDESAVNFLEESGYVSPDAKGPTNFGPASPNRRRDIDENLGNTSSCGVDAAPEARPTAHVASWSTDKALSDNAAQDVVVAAQTLKRRLEKTAVTCDQERKNLFAYYHGTLVGAYSGASVDVTQTSTPILDELIAELTSSNSSSSSRKALEACGGFCTAAHIFGVVADPSGDFGAVQEIVKTWNQGELLSGGAVAGKTLSPSSLWLYGSGNGTTSLNGTNATGPAVPTGMRMMPRLELDRRAECRMLR